MILGRFDHYNDSVNNKGTYYLTLNAFLIGAVFTAYTVFDGTLHFNTVIVALMSLSVSLGFISIMATMFSIQPFLKSGESKKYQSLMYFGAISKMKEGEFMADFNGQNDEAVQNDLLVQIHKLAEGLCDKYNNLKIAGWAVAAQFAIIVIIAISIFTNS